MYKQFFQRRSLLMAIDVIIVVVGYFLTYIAILPRYLWPEYFVVFRFTFLIIAVIYSISYVVGGIYKQMWRYADASEYRLCMAYSMLAGGAFILASGVINYHVPLRIQLLSPFVIGVLIVFSRIIYKILFQTKNESKETSKSQLVKVADKKRLAIVGAGEAGAALLKEIKSNSSIRYTPVIFVDDNPNKIGRKLYNVPIVGDVSQIDKFVDEYQIEEIIIAMPAISGAQKQKVVEYCHATNANVKILPSMAIRLAEESLAFESSTDILFNNLRKIEVEDLLGRETIKVNDTDISSYISGKNVLVTGGGGSIGSELCRQIVKYKANKLIVLDSHENGAYEIQQELITKHNYTPQVEIIDVKDKARLEKLFDDEKKKNTPIEIVFHAAAHKHVPLMEHNPESAIKNNIFGTYNVAQVANQFKAEKMILISTDKAVNPTNVMGATKRACELVMQMMDQTSSNTVFAAVRFGNVLGSNGSVIPLFKKQIENGGPVTVTHPEIIRYFMTIPEAVSLVLNAGGLAKGGEVFVLDMGDPVKILDLAKNLIKLAGLELGKDIDIVFTGLRPGEKLYEELLMSEEGLQTTESEKIFVGKAMDISVEELDNKLEAFKMERAQEDVEKSQEQKSCSELNMTTVEKQKEWLRSIVGTYRYTE